MLQGWLQSGDLAWNFAWIELCPSLPVMILHSSTIEAVISNMGTNHPNWISKSRVLLMLSPSRAPHSMKKPSRLPWIRIVLQIPWLFFITLNISATLPCSPHWPSKGFLLANGLLLSIWLKLYLCLWSQKVFRFFTNFDSVSKLDNANRANSSFWWEFFGLVVHFLCRGYYY